MGVDPYLIGILSTVFERSLYVDSGLLKPLTRLNAQKHIFFYENRK